MTAPTGRHGKFKMGPFPCPECGIWLFVGRGHHHYEGEFLIFTIGDIRVDDRHDDGFYFEREFEHVGRWQLIREIAHSRREVRDCRKALGELNQKLARAERRPLLSRLLDPFT